MLAENEEGDKKKKNIALKVTNVKDIWSQNMKITKVNKMNSWVSCFKN